MGSRREPIPHKQDIDRRSGLHRQQRRSFHSPALPVKPIKKRASQRPLPAPASPSWDTLPPRPGATPPHRSTPPYRRPPPPSCEPAPPASPARRKCPRHSAPCQAPSLSVRYKRRPRQNPVRLPCLPRPAPNPKKLGSSPHSAADRPGPAHAPPASSSPQRTLTTNH